MCATVGWQASSEIFARLAITGGLSPPGMVWNTNVLFAAAAVCHLVRNTRCFVLAELWWMNNLHPLGDLGSRSTLITTLPRLHDIVSPLLQQDIFTCCSLNFPYKPAPVRIVLLMPIPTYFNSWGNQGLLANRGAKLTYSIVSATARDSLRWLPWRVFHAHLNQ